MRFKHQGVFTDGNGRRIESAVVSVFLAGTDTAASVYADQSGGVAINSVTTDESGLYKFWVDDTDYTQDQLFKIIMAKTNFQSKTIDDIEIFKSNRLVLKGDKNSFIDGRTDPRVITLGAVRQEHTAGVPGTRAYHFDIRSDGFDDTSGIVIRHDLEGGSNTIRPKCLNLSVDVTGATNAHFNAIEVAKVGDIGAGMKVDALDVRLGVGVVDQESGTTGAADTAFKYDDSGASYTDVTTAFGSAGTDVSIFDEDSDYIYIGHATTFTAIEVILATVASKSVKPIFEYSQGASAWNTVSVSDDTNGFRENGNIFFEEPGDWATDTVNAVGSKYWFRIRRNNNNVPVVPIEDTIKVSSATNYSWDANGNLVVNDITSRGVMTANILQIDDTTGDHQYIFTVNELSADRNVDLPLLTGNDEVVMKDHTVTMTNKILTTPTIGDFTNANHDHSDAANGGTISGRSVQVVNTQTGAVNTGTTIFPDDDSIPQNTEGDEYITLAITPTSATNKLKIEVTLFGACSTATAIGVGLFQDSTADAVAAVSHYVGAGQMVPITFVHYMTTGTTSATTFKVRAGGGGASTLTFNGRGSGRYLGGVAASSITITETQA